MIRYNKYRPNHPTPEPKARRYKYQKGLSVEFYGDLIIDGIWNPDTVTRRMRRHGKNFYMHNGAWYPETDVQVPVSLARLQYRPR
ncbi:MAG: hypothetical protein AAB573_02405 [Patescibacteria group bacterium]